jgi:hypothetical protein
MLFDLLVYRAEHKDTRVPRSNHRLFPWVSMLRYEKTRLLPGVTPESQGYLTKERIQVLDSLDFVWDVVNADSEKRLNHWLAKFLVAYPKENGRCYYAPQRSELGKWVKVQPMNKTAKDQQEAQGGVIKKNKSVALSQERTDKLESIGFQFRIQKPLVSWEARFEQLVEFRKEQGNCNVPSCYPPDFSFARWVEAQRHGHSLKLKGSKTPLTDERFARLNEMGFRWASPKSKKNIVDFDPNSEAQGQTKSDDLKEVEDAANDNVDDKTDDEDGVIN